MQIGHRYTITVQHSGLFTFTGTYLGVEQGKLVFIEDDERWRVWRFVHADVKEATRIN
jgi:hypothetical protein